MGQSGAAGNPNTLSVGQVLNILPVDGAAAYRSVW